jgi:uncharacterized Fe-S cluster-containing radical SAM superfamily protein
MHTLNTSFSTLPIAACTHAATITYNGISNCSLCGAYMQQSPLSKQIRAFKLPKGVKNRLEISPSLIYESMIKQEKEPPLSTPVYLKVLPLSDTKITS